MRGRAIPLLVALACVGCGSHEGISTARTDPTLLVHGVQGRSDDAGVDGHVRYLEEADCFVLDSAGVRNVAVWPPGTKVWLDGARVAGVEVPDRDPIAIGSRLTGGGGYANPATTEIELPEVAADCLRGGGEFVSIHVISAITPPAPEGQ
ncbi:hypothetical protein SAMN05421812_11134 [Asanoa hainanensis]|uniref:Uncharacterized protein n=1 Tax=Asanoa hainanensis TaxID=560556 RepID=A0A239NUN3_9ACTN|nr:hypothetical protein [Asanoa hainanensis]SNT58631.1 hypothetical protein SAMN05421812_11134 [Asanoa hainanensis]